MFGFGGVEASTRKVWTSKPLKWFKRHCVQRLDPSCLLSGATYCLTSVVVTYIYVYVNAGDLEVRLAIALVLTMMSFVTTSVSAQERREVPEFRTYGTPSSQTAARDIDAFIESYKSAWGGQDTDALVALHAEDVEWINAYARMFQGAEPLRTFLKERLFPAFDPAVSRQEVANMKTISIRYMGDDAAVVHLYTDGQRGPSRNEGETRRRTHLHLVLEKQSAGWKVAHTAIMDAR